MSCPLHGMESLCARTASRAPSHASTDFWSRAMNASTFPGSASWLPTFICLLSGSSHIMSGGWCDPAFLTVCSLYAPYLRSTVSSVPCSSFSTVGSPRWASAGGMSCSTTPPRSGIGSGALGPRYSPGSAPGCSFALWFACQTSTGWPSSSHMSGTTASLSSQKLTFSSSSGPSRSRRNLPSMPCAPTASSSTNMRSTSSPSTYGAPTLSFTKSVLPGSTKPSSSLRAPWASMFPARSMASVSTGSSPSSAGGTSHTSYGAPITCSPFAVSKPRTLTYGLRGATTLTSISPSSTSKRVLCAPGTSAARGPPTRTNSSGTWKMAARNS
mmetsp:Transcript_6580/g.23204  ORF Transcript_6580/g.23204 Transcript_6580/m.23204 type:complete len:327 (+) Transcript_6580:1296-2276(+)